ncbi:YfjI family protein [Nocardiopsis sp. CC223A]|uniref:YfjI family protein n=1 Tax=Nocardiopsis sp. CC223A TaxID=3044051 RepID=UPI002795AC8D|nr:YfjI family protein [Nocardiopsis sp. CC223A]
MPTWIRDHVHALADQTQTPTDLAGCLSLAVLSAAASGRVSVDTGLWTEPCCLYTVIAMEPASRKSAVFGAMTAPLFEAEQHLTDQAAPRIRKAELQRRVAVAQAKEASRAAETEGTATALERAAAAAEEAAKITVPAMPRLIVADITPERLTSQLAEQDGGLALLSAEGGFFATMAGRYGGTPNFETFLKAHSGDPIRVDRQGRAPDYVHRPALTIGVVLQPEAIKDIFATPGGRGRGMLARILYSVPPSNVGYRSIGTRAPMDAQVRQTYHHHLHQLFTWARQHSAPTSLTLTDQARGRVVHLHDDVIEPQLRPDGRLGRIGDWGGKLLGAIVRIAGLLHLAHHREQADQRPIEARTLRAAEELGQYYAEHALTVFGEFGGSEADPVHAAARKALDWLQNRSPSNPTVSHRDLFAAVRCKATPHSDDLTPAVELLKELGWLRQAPPPAVRAPGRPSRSYLLHPTLYQR